MPLNADRLVRLGALSPHTGLRRASTTYFTGTLTGPMRDAAAPSVPAPA